MMFVAGGGASYLSDRLGHVELLEDRVHVAGGSGILETHVPTWCTPHNKRLELHIQDYISDYLKVVFIAYLPLFGKLRVVVVM